MNGSPDLEEAVVNHPKVSGARRYLGRFLPNGWEAIERKLPGPVRAVSSAARKVSALPFIGTAMLIPFPKPRNFVLSLLAAVDSDSLARWYLRGMRADNKPWSNNISRFLMRKVTKNAFDGTEVTGLESVIEELEKGGIALASTHNSFTDIGLPFTSEYSNNRMPPVFTMAGDNLLNFPVLGLPVGYWLRNSGAIFVERNEGSNAKVRSLSKKVTITYFGRLFDDGANIVLYLGGGKRGGRHKTGAPELFNTTVSQAIAEHARLIIPVYIMYSIVPEDQLFVSSGTKARKPIIGFMASMLYDAFVKHNHGFGKIYVNFGQPIDPKQYISGLPAGIPESRKILLLEEKVTEQAIRLGTLTPVNALCTAITYNDRPMFKLPQAIERARGIIDTATAAGINVASNLRDSDPTAPLYWAAETLLERGGLKILDDRHVVSSEMPLVEFYTNTIRKTLEAYGLQPAFTHA